MFFGFSWMQNCVIWAFTAVVNVRFIVLFNPYCTARVPTAQRCILILNTGSDAVGARYRAIAI